MHLVVSLPYDGDGERGAILTNVRRGLGSAGRDCNLLEMPPLSIDTIDNLFDAEEKIKTCEPLVQDTIKKFIEEHERIAGQPIGERTVLGKTFDHYIKAFSWDPVAYNTKRKVVDIARLIEDEINITLGYYTEKIKSFGEAKKKKEEIERKKDGTIYEVDINRLVHNTQHEEIKTALVEKYYLVVPGGVTREIAEKLMGTSGLFIEARSVVYKSPEGEIVEVVGKRGIGPGLEAELSAEGIKLKSPLETREEYLASLEQDKVALAKYEDLKLAMLSFIGMQLTALFKTLMHVKILSLFVESILRFGLPATFFFFVSNVEADLGKALSHWKKVSKRWEYSARIMRVSKIFRDSTEMLPLHDFVYTAIRDFRMDPPE
jgi:V-type H+-transporting ATPase subunit C